jgi:hypothetical protein
MDFQHVEKVRRLLDEKATAHAKRLQLPGGEARLIKNSNGVAQLWLSRKEKESGANSGLPNPERQVTKKARVAGKMQRQDTIAAEEKA